MKGLVRTADRKPCSTLVGPSAGLPIAVLPEGLVLLDVDALEVSNTHQGLGAGKRVPHDTTRHALDSIPSVMTVGPTEVGASEEEFAVVPMDGNRRVCIEADLSTIDLDGRRYGLLRLLTMSEATVHAPNRGVARAKPSGGLDTWPRESASWPGLLGAQVGLGLDPLTGLSNRAGFHQQFIEVVDRCQSMKSSAALLVLDVDQFKDINDTLGHAAGDDLIREVSLRLRQVFRRSEIIARLGGDEFAIVIPGVSEHENIDRVVDRVQSVFDTPFDLGAVEVFASIGVGIATYPADGTNACEVFAHADSAMHNAKASGRGGVRYYSRDLTEDAALRLALSNDLRVACLNDQLELFYQPKVAMSDERCIGAEALLRWNHPERGLLSPDSFISLAEETGAIVDIGRWVLVEACRTATELNLGSATAKRIAVNLSSRQFACSDVVADVLHALAVTACRGEWLECEITESLILSNDTRVQAALVALGKMGVTVAIDDFGTGQSALSVLSRFQVDVLKIDRSFVCGMENDDRKAELVRAFISIADALKLETVAEGIENADQAALLKRFGCPIGQGYKYGRPVPRHVFRSSIDCDWPASASLSGARP